MTTIIYKMIQLWMQNATGITKTQQLLLQCAPWCSVTPKCYHCYYIMHFVHLLSFCWHFGRTTRVWQLWAGWFSLSLYERLWLHAMCFDDYLIWFNFKIKWRHFLDILEKFLLSLNSALSMFFIIIIVVVISKTVLKQHCSDKNELIKFV